MSFSILQMSATAAHRAGTIRGPQDAASVTGTDAQLNDILRRALSSLEADLARPVRLKALASALGISRTHLSALFKAASGLTPHQWRLRRRLHHATQLLAGRDSITDVALACGFNSSQHFATAFRRHYGTTPSAYRAAVSAPARSEARSAGKSLVTTLPNQVEPLSSKNT